jgi:ABC-type dipeptide/oligopeptide/nickel transport system permease component
VTSVTNRDYPVLMGVTLMLASVVAVVNLMVDVIYAYLDPRIRYG